MKTHRKRILCFILVLLCMFMISCAKSEGQAVIEYRDQGKTLSSLDTGFMYFWVSFQKSIYSAVAQSYEDGWEHITDEETGERLYDLLMTEATESAKNLLAIEYMHDKELKLKLSDESKDLIQKQIDSYVALYGSEEALDSALSMYGASVKTLKRYFELMLKQNVLVEMFCGENGAFIPTEDEAKAYFAENYVIADHIFWSFIAGTKEDGTVVSLSDEQVEKKRSIAREVYSRIASLGEDFDALKKQYNEDVLGEQYYPHGFFVTSDDSFPAEFTNGVLKLSQDEVSIVETSKTGIHVIKILEMNENLYNAYEDVYQSVVSALSTQKFKELLSQKSENTYVNEALMSSYNPEVISQFSLG